MAVFEYFVDPILRGPAIGSMLMCLSASLVGVILFLKKQSLAGEALSHAAYPGVIFAVLFAWLSAITPSEEILWQSLILFCAFVTALLGLWVVHVLENKLRVPSDAALCFVLSGFFGVGLTLASHLQFCCPSLYKNAQGYLFGQAATMTDIHIAIYGILSFIVIAVSALFRKELQIMTFSPEYAVSLGLPITMINSLLFIITALAIVTGIRSVGVVLMSAMLISPVAAARQFANQLSTMMLFSGLFGLVSGFLGVYFSVELSFYLSSIYPGSRLSIPTGPTIVLVASLLCILSLLCAPKKGLIHRFFRMMHFRYHCIGENVLKTIWRLGPDKKVSLDEIKQYQHVFAPFLKFILMRLVYNGWLVQLDNHTFQLTSDGNQRAAHIVRLHRLWEVYLVDYLGVGVEKVHRNAEEMEHIITPDIERELTLLLNDPLLDPHRQEIPRTGG